MTAGDDVVARSELITTMEEAKRYYAERLAGVHSLNCYGRKISLYFPPGYTHVYSVSRDKAVEAEPTLVRRRVKGGDVEIRAFSLERARLMDQILPAVRCFTVSVPDRGSTARRRLYGPRLADHRYLCVVLRQGSVTTNWDCVTAFPVSANDWLKARRANTARFP